MRPDGERLESCRGPAASYLGRSNLAPWPHPTQQSAPLPRAPSAQPITLRSPLPCIQAAFLNMTIVGHALRTRRVIHLACMQYRG
jgi:hypothetical protein